MKTRLRIAIIVLALAIIACGQDVKMETCTRKCSIEGGTDNKVQTCIEECVR